MTDDDLTFVLMGTQYEFKPLSGPLEQTPRPDFFADFGYALAAWSRMEHLLTLLVIHINKKASSAILHEPDPQAKFTKLLKLYGKWMGRHPEFAPMRSPHSEVFFQGLLKQADIRNEFAHGAVSHYDEATGDFKLLLTKRVGPDTWRMRETKYAGEVLKRFSHLTNLAHRHFVEVAKALFEKIDPPPTRTP